MIDGLMYSEDLIGVEYTVKGRRANEKWKQERKENGMKERERVCV